MSSLRYGQIVGEIKGWGEGCHEFAQGELGVAGGRGRSQALEMPFVLTKTPLLRALHERTMGCDLSTYIFSCAL